MRPARHDPLLSGLNPAAAAFEFAVVWLTMAGFALTAIPAETARGDWLTFAILVPIIAAVHLVVVERVRSFVEGSSSDPKVTVSVGVATHRGGGTTTEALVALADRAAYRAKFSGRNSVAVPPEGDPVDEAERLLHDASR
jgi:GGDEF domain-containing protein